MKDTLSTPRARLILLVGLILPIVIMAVVIRGFVRDVIAVPLLYGLWIVRGLLASIAQPLVWFACILVIIVFAFRSLVGTRILTRRRKVEQGERDTLQSWARLIEQTQRDDFSRWRLAQRLGQLTFDILGDDEQLSARQLWRRLDNGTLDIPPDLRGYLRFRVRPAPQRRWWRRTTTPSQQQIDPNRIVTFLEEQIAQTPGGPT